MRTFVRRENGLNCIRSRDGAAIYCSINLVSAEIVRLGFSSISQWPVFFRTTIVTFEATSLACAPSATPSDLSPPIDSTGIFNCVLAIAAKSEAVFGNDAKYAQPEAVRPGREYAAMYP